MMLATFEVDSGILIATAFGATATLLLSHLGQVLLRWRANRFGAIWRSTNVRGEVTTRPERYRISAPRLVAPVKAAQILIEFMQWHGAVGHHTAKEIDEWWRYCARERALGELHPTVVREMLSEIPGIYAGYRRLNTPEFVAVKTRTGKVRATIYRIPPQGRSLAGQEADQSTSVRRATGQRPASAKKRILSTTAAHPKYWSEQSTGAPGKRAA